MMAMLMLANGGVTYAGYTFDDLELPDGGAQTVRRGKGHRSKDG
jgi:hypothetical protein